MGQGEKGPKTFKESWKGWKPHKKRCTKKGQGEKMPKKAEKGENLIKQALVITRPPYCCASVKKNTLSTRVLISYLYLGNLIFLPWDFRLSLLTGFALLEIFPVLLLCWHHSASLPVRSTLSYHIWSTIEIWTFREDPRIQALKRNLLAVYSSSVKCINLNFNMGR